jgi:hypothetical protein
MTTMQQGMAVGARRSRLGRLLDALFEPTKGRPARLDPRSLPPYLQRDMGLPDLADEVCRPERPPAGL